MNWPLKKKQRRRPNGQIIEMVGITKVYDTGKIKVEALRGIDLVDPPRASSSPSSGRRVRASRR